MSKIDGMQRFSLDEIDTSKFITIYYNRYSAVLDKENNVNFNTKIKNSNFFSFRTDTLLKLGKTNCWYENVNGYLKIVFENQIDADRFENNIQSILPSDFKLVDYAAYIEGGVMTKQIVEVQNN